MFFIKRIKKSLPLLLCIIIIHALITDYNEIKEEIIQSSVMWCTVLLPSVFPYLVLSQYIISSGILSRVSGLLEAPLKRILRTNSYGIETFFCSLICGYPSGAVCSADLYRRSLISKKEAEHIIGFTNNAGPLYLISAVGTGMAGNTADGIALYIIQIFSCVCCAFITGEKNNKSGFPLGKNSAGNQSNDLCQCIKTAVAIMVNTGGFIIITSVVCRIIIIRCSQISTTHDPDWLLAFESIVYTLFEISKACVTIVQLPRTPVSFAILCAAVSWSGISVFMQVKSSLPPEIKINGFIRAKFIQAITSFASGYIYKTFLVQKHFYLQHNIILISFVLTVLIFFWFINQIRCGLTFRRLFKKLR